MEAKKSINKVTTTNLDIALRMVNIELHKTIIDKVIDLVEMIEEKGDNVTIKDICELQVSWKNTQAMMGKLSDE